ncbi:hypothetical protein [Cellulomonas sp. NPDC058312]|uniref:hypothetical protein n=1 Tax=Cellulomonas sp. NPDC058312 TaxID=3346441 RepID=UPI0036E54DF3
MSAAMLTALAHTAHGAALQLGAVLPAGLPLSPTPSPSPSTLEIPPEDQTSPGLLGFLVTFAVAAAVIGLGYSLVRHLRVVDRNARRRDEADAAREAAATDDPPAGP